MVPFAEDRRVAGSSGLAQCLERPKTTCPSPSIAGLTIREEDVFSAARCCLKMAHSDTSAIVDHFEYLTHSSDSEVLLHLDDAKLTTAVALNATEPVRDCPALGLAIRHRSSMATVPTGR